MIVEVQIRLLKSNLTLPIVLIFRFEKQFQYNTSPCSQWHDQEFFRQQTLHISVDRSHRYGELRRFEVVF